MGQKWQNVRYDTCTNVGSQEIPPWGVVEVTGTVETNGLRLIQVQRPSVDNPDAIMFNGPTVIPASKAGACSADFPAQCLGSLSAGDAAAPQKDSFELAVETGSAGTGGSLIVLGAGGEDGTVLVALKSNQLARWIEFTVDADLAPTDATAACTVAAFHDGIDPDPDTAGLTIHFDLAYDAHEDNAGVAVLGSDGNYHCRHIDQKARWIEITVTGALTAGPKTQACVVTAFHLGSDPGTPQTVHFDLKFESDSGGVGIATLGSDGNYHCRNIDCPT